MGLGSPEPIQDSGGGGGKPEPVEDSGGGGGNATASSASCSICLEAVVDGGDRSWAKLQCGHRFHLDCIGSAFNSKGAMQCPNCRKTEKGQWLYADGCCPVSDFNLEDWPNDDDLNDLSSYADLSFWSPFGGLASLPSILDEAEFSPVPSHPCPYVAYVSPSSSIFDGPSFGNLWSGPSAPGESPNSYPLPSMEPHYRVRDQFFATNLLSSGVDQSPISTQRAARDSSEMIRPPFGMGHSSAVRNPSPVRPSSLHHPALPVAQPGDRFQQTPRATNPVVTLPTVGRRSNNSHQHRMTMSSGTAASSSDQSSSAPYFFDRNRLSYGWQQQQHQHQHRSSPETNPSPMWMLPSQFQPSSADNRSHHHHHRHHHHHHQS